MSGSCMCGWKDVASQWEKVSEKQKLFYVFLAILEDRVLFYELVCLHSQLQTLFRLDTLAHQVNREKN